MMKMISMMMLHNMMGKNDIIEEKKVSNKLKHIKKLNNYDIMMIVIMMK